MKNHGFLASIFASIFGCILDGKWLQNRAKEHRTWALKSPLFGPLFRTSILGCILVTFWLTFGSHWLPFGHFWLPFGSLGSLLAPFWLQWAHFWHPLAHFCSPRGSIFSLLTSPSVILVHFRTISSKSS